MVTPDDQADQQADAHRDRLTALYAADGSLSATSPHASTRNPDWFSSSAGGGLRIRPARRDLHRRLVAEAEARHPQVRRDRQAVVLAGPPGAGKSSALRQLLEAAGSRPEHWRVIDSDDFKDDLLQQALRDGSYYRWLVPAEVAELEAAGERFYPRELVSLVHAESGMLAQRATRRACERGDNLIVDGTLAHERGAHLLLGQLAAAGYQVRIVDVEAPRDVVEARVAGRWRAGYLAAQNGTARTERDAELGGRWVPSAFAGSLFPPGRPTESVCAAVARAVAERHDVVRQYQLYRVTRPDTGPALVEQRGRVGTSSLLDQETFHAAQTAQTARGGVPPPTRPRRDSPRRGSDRERD